LLINKGTYLMVCALQLRLSKAFIKTSLNKLKKNLLTKVSTSTYDNSNLIFFFQRGVAFRVIPENKVVISWIFFHRLCWHERICNTCSARPLPTLAKVFFCCPFANTGYKKNSLKHRRRKNGCNIIV
jgi:hypothetical protein